MSDVFDVFDEIAEEVTHHPLWAKPERFAAAFRQHFAQRTCATCVNHMPSSLPSSHGYCKRGISCGSDWSFVPPEFSCAWWEKKA